MPDQEETSLEENAFEQEGTLIEPSAVSRDRVMPRGFFPMSPQPTPQEAVLAPVLARILGAKPKVDGVDAWLDCVRRHAADGGITDEAAVNHIRDATWELYTFESKSHKQTKNRYPIVFHPLVAKAIKQPEQRNWGRWYEMLMTSKDSLAFDSELHHALITKLDGLTPSNLLEELVSNAVADNWDPIDHSEVARRPYNGQIAARFREDVAAWLRDDTESPSDWLYFLGVLITHYIVMDFLQLARNLDHEFKAASQGQEFTPDVIPIYFGLPDEKASKERRFTHEAKDPASGLKRQVYDSWGRLAALLVINDCRANNTDPPLHLGELRHALTSGERQTAIKRLNAACEELGQTTSDDLAHAANNVAKGLTRWFEAGNEAPDRGAVRVIDKLASAGIPLLRKQRKVGWTFRADDEALAFWAKIQVLQSERLHFQEFLKRLEARGIAFDGATKRLVMSSLERMGMIERQSDSGDAVYVRTL